jgi:hypothetical protein
MNVEGCSMILGDLIRVLEGKNENLFAPRLCKCLCAIKKNTELWSKVNEQALAEENEYCAPLKAKEADLLKALQNEYAKVERYCEEHNILIPIGFMGPEGISEFRAYEQSRIIASVHIIWSLIQAYNNALVNLVSIDLEFVKQLAFVNDKGDITALKIYPLINEWDAEKQKIERTEDTTFWYNWKQFNRFHDLYHNYEQSRIYALSFRGLLSYIIRRKYIFVSER